MTPLEILHAARARLVSKGWTQGIGNCIVMTIESVVPDEVWYGPDKPQCIALDAIRTVVGIPPHSTGFRSYTNNLPMWNMRQPSIEPVLAAVDKAIALLQIEAA